MQRHHVRLRAVQVRLGEDIPPWAQVAFQECQQVRLARREGRGQGAEVRSGWEGQDGTSVAMTCVWQARHTGGSRVPTE